MNCLLWYNGRDYAGNAWIPDSDSASTVAKALKLAGYKVVWTVHSTDTVRPMQGYEQALADWRRDTDL